MSRTITQSIRNTARWTISAVWSMSLIAAAFAILYTSGFTRAWHPGLLGEAIGAARSDLRALNTRVVEWAGRRPENWPSPVEKSP